MWEKLKLVLRYLFHILRMRSRFRIHSPFVYNFYKNILSDKTRYPDYDLVENVRADLLTRYRFIKRTDLGARSRDFPFSQRFVRVKDVARNSSVSRRKGQFLYRLVRYYKPRAIIELGTSFGISTMYMALGYRNSRIITLEGCTDTIDIARHNFTRLGLGNIEEVCGGFEDKLPEALRKADHVDLVFVDGNHRKDATLHYFDQCLEHAQNNTIFVFDDIHWSRDMHLAWVNIREHPSVRVSIDLFTMGLVFFRKELSKEDFLLRM
jgi:predicted O-methyltransferase YrrM